MNPVDQTFPRCSAVADHAVLVEFGETIGRDVNDQVRRLDAAIARQPFAGFIEAVPAYVSLLVEFDPCVTDHVRVEVAIRALLDGQSPYLPSPGSHEILVCYDVEFAPDLAQVATATGYAIDDVIAAHLSGDYRVYLYGFAPGYAYLAGVPEGIQLPRKAAAVRGIAAGSVIIAGAQCLVTTLTMPTGWWVIGRSPTQILRNDADRPFLFDVGDSVTFRRIDRTTFEAENRRG